MFFFLYIVCFSTKRQLKMSGITVQLVFALVGTRVPYHMCEPTTVNATGSPLRSPYNVTIATSTSFSAAAQSSLRTHSANSSPSLGPSACEAAFTAQQLLTRLAEIAEPLQEIRQPSPDDAVAAAASSPALPSASATHKAPLLELLDYETMAPLESTAALHDEMVLLVLCDPQTSVELVEALQLEWLEAYSGAHRPHLTSRPSASFTPASATEMAVCTTEERLRNVAHARLALCKPAPLHMRLLEKEAAECTMTLASQVDHLHSLKLSAEAVPSADAATPLTTPPGTEGSSAVHGTTTLGVAERFPLLVELEPSLASELASDSDSAHAASNEGSLLMCETQLSAKQTLVCRITKQLAKLTQLAAAEEEKERAFAASGDAQALQAYVEGTEQDRNAAEEIVKVFQAEMMRQLKSVRLLVAHVTHLRNVVKKTRREMGAIDLVLTRLAMTLLRPRLLEQAEALLRRRVILRRAARRQLLLLQETEYGDLQRDLSDFSQLREVQQVLPPKVRWYLRAPLPSLHPVEDVVATLLDHALIDRDVDAAQELVERTRVALPPHVASSLSTELDAAQTAQEITDALLPVERLVRRAEKAEADAAAYKVRVEELEQRVREYEAGKDASSKSLDTAETEAFQGNGAEEASPS